MAFDNKSRKVGRNFKGGSIMFWEKYVFYETDESFDYPTGYGYDTCYQKGEHGFEVKYDDNVDVIDWDGFGEFGVDVNRTKGDYKAFYEFVLSVKDEYKDAEAIDELLEFIANSAAERKKENGKKIATS